VGKFSRDKGARWERDVANIFKEASGGGDDIRRSFGQYRKGSDAPDVYHPIFNIECKVGKRINVLKALEQADSYKENKNKYSVAVCKLDRKEPFIAMYLKDFLKLVDEL